MNKWRTIKIEQLSKIISKEEYIKIYSLIDNLNTELKTLLSLISDDLDIIKGLECLDSAGNFRNYIIKQYGKPYKTWDHIQGNKAKYYRIIIEQARKSILSLKERIIITEICKKYNYDINNDNIIEELKDDNIDYTEGIIRNICRTRKEPVFNTDIDFILDFTSEDNQISNVKYYNNKVYYSVKICDEWVNISVSVPDYVRLITGKFARPIIQKNKENQELYLRVVYETPEVKMISNKKDTTGVLSCDLGKIKPFSAAITYEDGSYSTELIASRELERLNEKLSVLNKEKNLLWSKIDRNSSLLKGKHDDYLFNHLEDQYSQRKLIINKITRLKEHMGWVIARDIMMHAYYHNVNTLKVEDLKWLDSRGGKWDFSNILSKLIEISELYGVTVLLVSARNSSHTDPFSKERVSPLEDRTVNTSNGVMDRDYCAALELGTRKGRGIKKSKIVDKGKKKKRVLKRGRTRDKHCSTPKRPRVLRRTTCHKLMKKRNVSLSDFENTTGASIAVMSSGIVSNNVLCLPLCDSVNVYSKVL